MARVLIFLADGPNTDGRPFLTKSEAVDMSRVPSVGEVLTLEDDEHGGADYRVALVRHDATGDGAADAEIYAVRVSIADVIRAAAPTTAWQRRNA